MSDFGTRIKEVAARKAIEAYAEFKRCGEVRNPGIAAAAYAELRQLLEFLEEQGMADIEYNGSDLVAIINEAENSGNGEET